MRAVTFFEKQVPVILAVLGFATVAITGITSASASAIQPEDLPAQMGADPAGSASYEFELPAPPAASARKRQARTSASRGRGGGGVTVPPVPEISDIYCVKLCVSRHEATPGAIVRLTGAGFDLVKKVVFPGKTRRMKVQYRARSSTAVRVEVPRGADDGRPFVVDSYGTKSNRAPSELQIVSKRRIPKEVFPVRGPHSYGSGGSRFGAGRPGHTHQGQDISAACGTKLVAVKRARVAYNDYQSAAGNYVVLSNKGDNTVFVYMHMIRPSKLKVGTIVNAGEPVGRVGTTGSSSGCHLHFEYWVGPWQTGGEPIDPLHYLKSL